MFDKSINTYFLILFSLIPISIILGPSVSLINILVIDFSFIFLILTKKDFSFLWTKTMKYLLILYLYLVFNSLISLDYTSGLYRNLGFIRMIILFVAFNYFFNQILFFNKIFTIWLITLFIIIADIFWESYMGVNILGFGGDIYGRRIVSFFKNEPIVGGFVNSFYLIMIGFLFNKFKGEYKNTTLIISVIFLFAILLTGERANSIKALMGLLVFYSLLREYELKKRIIFLFSILTLVFVLIINSEYLKLRFIDQTQSYLTKNQIYFNLYKSGFEVFKNHKLFGVGNKNYRVETCVKKEISKKINKNYICTTHPHQIYFEMLSEHGLFGLITIFYIFYKMIFSKIMETF